MKFPKTSRLLNRAQFDRVFKSARKLYSPNLTLLYRANGEAHPRLGMIVSRKSYPHAVDRNRFKRMARETFRLSAQKMPDIDIVIIAKKKLPALSTTDLGQEFEQLWRRLKK
ncbi:MAG: ribonuclease P protein component [Gammaproteobacteria bacterium]